MRTGEQLYSKIPPSFKRKLVPFIEAEPSDFWRYCADKLFAALIQYKFKAFRIKNPHYINKRDKTKPTIVYAPHICWWDASVAYFFCRRILRLDTRFMAEELHRMTFFRKLGIFSIDKKSPKTMLKSLNFAIKNLDSPDKALFLYPQGIICPQDCQDFSFNSGISYIASRLDGVNLIPLAIRYGFLRGTSPEVLVEVNEPIVLGKIQDRQELDYLGDHFKYILEKQRLEVASGELNQYITLLQKNKIF
jgi:1-acyl-sn-glycerol-3-phosphate acyltransferase